MKKVLPWLFVVFCIVYCLAAQINFMLGFAFVSAGIEFPIQVCASVLLLMTGIAIIGAAVKLHSKKWIFSSAVFWTFSASLLIIRIFSVETSTREANIKMNQIKLMFSELSEKCLDTVPAVHHIILKVDSVLKAAGITSPALTCCVALLLVLGIVATVQAKKSHRRKWVLTAAVFWTFLAILVMFQLGTGVSFPFFMIVYFLPQWWGLGIMEKAVFLYGTTLLFLALAVISWIFYQKEKLSSV